jgi:hypothetical protein
MFMSPCIVTNFFIIKPTRCTNFPNLLRHKTLHVSAVPLPIIRILFTVHSTLVYTYAIQVCRQLSSRTRMVLLESSKASSWFYYKEICYDARSHERKITNSSKEKLNGQVWLVGWMDKRNCFVLHSRYVEVRYCAG